MTESEVPGSVRTIIQSRNIPLICHDNGHYDVVLTFRTTRKSQNGRHAVNLEETGAHLRLTGLKNREPIQSVHCLFNAIRHTSEENLH